MKIYIDEEWDSGECNFIFDKDINKYKSDDPYILDIDDKEVERWEKIIAEKERIDKEYYDVVYDKLYELKKTLDNELVEVVCPRCKHSLAIERENIPYDYGYCYYCDCLMGWDEKKHKYYVHSGEGVASIDRTFWKTAEEKAKDKAERKKYLIKREQEAKQGGLKKK